MIIFTNMILLVASLAITLAVSVPFAGALVRFRAHYNPKGLQLDPEGGVQPRAGLVITSFFAMLVRIYRIEGWSGLYRGLMSTILLNFIVTLLVFFIGYSDIPNRALGFSTPWISALTMLACALFVMLVSLPLTIITNRAITTPHKLPYFNAVCSLRVLLTPTERRRPWILYLTPGLLAVQVLHVAYVALGFRTVRYLLFPELTRPLPSFNEDIVVRLAIFVVVALASTIVLTPLDVITTRLTIQRNHAAPEFNSVSQEGDAEEVPGYAGIDEDVIDLRTEREPYTGLVDCAKKIIDEEGWSALYRAWWLTMFGCLGTAFSP